VSELRIGVSFSGACLLCGVQISHLTFFLLNANCLSSACASVVSQGGIPFFFFLKLFLAGIGDSPPSLLFCLVVCIRVLNFFYKSKCQSFCISSVLCLLFSFCLFVFAILGFVFRVSCLLDRYATTWATLLVLFCMGYFWYRVSQTIAQAYLKLWCSWSLPVE
jgi:hypothetical protein